METRIYLTNGENDENNPWGGNHITIVGFHTKNINLISRLPPKKQLFDNKNNWRPSNNTPYWLEKIGGNWTICFRSNVLNEMSEKLCRLGFHNIKGPIYDKNNFDWHITLKNYSKTQAITYTESLFKEKKPWYLTIAYKVNNKSVWVKI